MTIRDILWHGVDPRFATGYGLQTGLIVPRLADAGYNVVISAMTPPPDGVPRGASWDGIKVIGPAQTPYGLPHLEVQRAFGRPAPDLVITLKDCWTLPAGDFRRHRTLSLCPIDTQTMSVPDQEFFSRSAAVPAAISLHGLSAMRAAGLDPVYLPHGIELSQWSPPADKSGLRRDLGLPEAAFIVGMNAANIAAPGFPSRKGFDEAFAAFAQFRHRHPAAILLCHTRPLTDEGIDLLALRHYHGLDGAVIYPADPTSVSHDDLLSWYQALDVYLAPSYGEGFCVPVAEALACGVPVIATDCTALSERVPPGAGWLVKAQPWWNPHHITHWAIPSVHGLTGALEKAYQRRGTVPAGTRAAVAHLDADAVFARHWAPALERMENEAGPVTILTTADRARARRTILPDGRDLAVLVPSRGRPESVARLLAAVRSTAALRTDVWFGFDDDDPHLAANIAAAGSAHVIIRPRMGLAPWTNELAAATLHYPWLCSMGDDHLPKTPGWDAELVKAAGETGMAYPNDLVRDDICEVILMSSAIADVLGWMCPPDLDHWFIDNTWADLGKQAGCLAWCPDVIVEHLHHSQKKREFDGTDRAAWRKVAADKMTYDTWRGGPLAAAARKIRALISEGGGGGR